MANCLHFPYGELFALHPLLVQEWQRVWAGLFSTEEKDKIFVLASNNE